MIARAGRWDCRQHSAARSRIQTKPTIGRFKESCGRKGRGNALPNNCYVRSRHMSYSVGLLKTESSIFSLCLISFIFNPISKDGWPRGVTLVC